MPFLRPPRYHARAAQQQHPLPAQGVTQMAGLFETWCPRAMRLLAGKKAAQIHNARRCGKTAQHHAGQKHVAHGPTGRSQCHEQREEQGYEVGIVKTQQGTGQKSRCNGCENTGGHARLNTAQRPYPSKSNNSHKACQQSGKPKGHRCRGGSGHVSHAFKHHRHGMPHGKTKIFCPGHPSVSIVGSQKPFTTKPVFRVLPAGPFEHTQGKGQGKGQRTPKQTSGPVTARWQ